MSFVLNGDGASLANVSADDSRMPVSFDSAVEHYSQKSGKRWAPDLDDRLRVMWGQGALVKRIAAQLGRSEASINSRIRLLELPKRRSKKNTVQKSQNTATVNTVRSETAV